MRPQSNADSNRFNFKSNFNFDYEDELEETSQNDATDMHKKEIESIT